MSDEGEDCTSRHAQHDGFTVTGESACASPENFDEQIGCWASA